MPGYIGKRCRSSYLAIVEGSRDPVTGKRIRTAKVLKGRKRDAEKVLHEIVAESG